MSGGNLRDEEVILPPLQAKQTPSKNFKLALFVKTVVKKTVNELNSIQNEMLNRQSAHLTMIKKGFFINSRYKIIV